MNRYCLDQYDNPFTAIQDFEEMLANYTGAPYAVVVNCCTHAIEIALRLKRPAGEIVFPAKTYLSVLMTMHKLHIPYRLQDIEWRDDRFYQFTGSNVWDCARFLEPNMYQPNTLQCLSFGRTKPLEIGQGGCLLTDDESLAQRARMMCYDGRDIFSYKKWADQQTFNLGFHYYLRPEECVKGMNLLASQKFTPQISSYFDYPDCSKIKIIDENF